MPLPVQTSKLVQPRAQSQPISFRGFPLGINRTVGAKQLTVDEMTECLNFKYTDDGRLVTRQGLTKLTTAGATAGAAIKYISNGLVGQEGAFFDEALFDVDKFEGDTSLRHCVIVADANYKVYYLEGTGLYVIGTAEGAVKVAPFAGYVMIFDGSYLKYWDGNAFQICYDYGSGSGGFQFDNTDLDQDTTDNLYNGAHTRYGSSFTTQAWTAGMTIPLLNVKAVLSKTGTPTGYLVAKLYSADRSAVHATSTNFDVSDLTADPTSVDIEFDPDNTYRMAPSTAYFISLEYSGGDAGNCVNVSVDTVASAGTAAYYNGSWTAVGTQTPCIGVQPGRPPKGSYGCAWQNRLWFIDPDSPGLVKYTNANTIFDYSTASGGGFIGSVDENAKNSPVGTIIPHYGNLFMIGRKEAPFISKVTGSGPTDYSQEVLLQGVSASPLVTASSGNDIWITDYVNTYSIRGVQEYGDIRRNEPGNPVASTIETYFDDNAFAAYNPLDGQYWLKLTGYAKVLVCHARRGSQTDGGVRYPWTEYLFNGVIPSAFGFSIDTFYVGGTDGHLYSMSADVNDNGSQPVYTLKSCIIETPFGGTQFREYFASLSTDTAGTMSMKVYKNGSTSALLTRTLTVNDARVGGKLRFNCRSIQIELSSFTITKPVNIGEIHFKTHPMEVA